MLCFSATSTTKVPQTFHSAVLFSWHNSRQETRLIKRNHLHMIKKTNGCITERLVYSGNQHKSKDENYPHERTPGWPEWRLALGPASFLGANARGSQLRLLRCTYAIFFEACTCAICRRPYAGLLLAATLHFLCIFTKSWEGEYSYHGKSQRGDIRLLPLPTQQIVVQRNKGLIGFRMKKTFWH